MEREEEIFRRKVEMKMTRELAIKAQEDNVQFKQEFARDAKDEASRQKHLHEMEQAALLEENRILVKIIEDQKENVREEVKKMVEKNHIKRIDQQTELAKAMEQKRIDEEEELARRKELIEKIKEISKNIKKHEKDFDPTTTAGFGLLDEMSLAELQNKLTQVKNEHQQKIEDKNKQILQDKQDKVNSLKSKIEKVKLLREKEKEKRIYAKSKVINNKVVIRDAI